MSSQSKDLKQECYEANMQLNALNLVVYTFGNVERCEHKKNGILPLNQAVLPYEDLKPEDIIIVRF